jgi:flagellar biosynthesis GTPase FlhF
MANAKKNKKNTGVATEATVENNEVIVATDEVVLDAPSELVSEEVIPTGFAKCSAGGEVLEQTVANFSPVDAVNNPNGEAGFRPICKGCQTKASIAWTTKRADYRKAYQRAVQLIKLGIPAIVPNAKDWKAGDVIMTIEFERDGVVYPSMQAEHLYTAQKLLAQEARAERQAEIDAQNDRLKEERKAERAKAREAREQAKADEKAKADEARAERKRQRDLANTEKAEQAKRDREARAEERAEAKRKRDAEKAEENRIARENREKARQEKRDQKALEDAQAVLDAKAEREANAKAKAMGAVA